MLWKWATAHLALCQAVACARIFSKACPLERQWLVTTHSPRMLIKPTLEAGPGVCLHHHIPSTGETTSMLQPLSSKNMIQMDSVLVSFLLLWWSILTKSSWKGGREFGFHFQVIAHPWGKLGVGTQAETSGRKQWGTPLAGLLWGSCLASLLYSPRLPAWRRCLSPWVGSSYIN